MNCITVEKLYEEYKSGSDFRLIDVRSPEEYNLGHVPSASLFPLDTLINEPSAAIDLLPEIAMHEALYIICLSDRRSYIAAKILSEIGVSNCTYVKGGTHAWQEKGYPLSCKVSSVSKS